MSTSHAGSAAPHVAIVGSGPSGCYAAQMLRKQWPSAEITVFDRLPVPFGLLRYGVAPDHQHTKQLAHQFTRVFQDERTRFAGNVEVGRTVTLERLREGFHVVVLAAGLSGDRRLGVPGEDLPGVVGAGRVMRWVNAHPDEADLGLSPGEETVVVGAGNVAIDVIRMLVKEPAHFVGTDVHPPALEAMEVSRPRHIHVVSRSSAASAKWDVAMVRELGTIPGVAFELGATTADDLAADGAKAEALAGLVSRDEPEAARTVVTFHFGWTPTAVTGAEHVEGVTFVRSEGTDVLELSAHSVVTAIGFVGVDDDPLAAGWPSTPGDGADRGRLDEGVYSCGWFRRGATGSIPTNRACAKEVVARIVEDIDVDALPARPGFAHIEGALPGPVVGFDGWRRIDAVETATAGEQRIRRKLADRQALLDAASGDSAPLQTYSTAST